MKNTQRRSSNKKKLVSAISMLTVSAVMLSTATYAWFTMNKEVELKNIQMTATVPEDMQISIGKTLNYAVNNSSDYLDLNEGAVQNPREGTDGDAYDWTNSIDVSHYYTFGKIIPASSNNGAKIFFTPDAVATGKELGDGARYFQADGTTDGDLKHTLDTTVSASTDTNSLMATAHPLAASDTWATNTYTQATSWSDTNDDGYYVDIPIWLRSSNTTDTNIKVEGYVTKIGGTTGTLGTDDDLYMATRVALLRDPTGSETGLQPVTTNNIIPLQNANTFGETTKSILDSKNYTVTRDSTGTLTDTDLYGLSAAAPTYTSYTAYAGASVVTLPAPTSGAEYGAGQKLYVRVWLDGEDENCWNDNAGQDWSISLKFSKVTT